MERSKMVVKVADEDDALIGLPPGFRFHPTDEEIVTHYLTPKVLDRSFRAIAIGEADLNKSEPWDLPKKAKMGEKEWFFFCQRDRKYPTGMRTNRATESGYWKATGKDKEIRRPVGGELMGMKKTLVFYRGRAPSGVKTNWVMHEFRLEGKFSYYTMPTTSIEDEWVVCRVFHKSMGAQKSPVSNHGLNSFVEDFLNSSPQLHPLMDHSTLDDEPNFTIGNHYFSHDQPEIPQNEDYKNVIVSSSDYNFNDNSYHISSFMSEHLQYVGKNPPCLSSESTFYSSNFDLMKEKKNVIDQYKVEHFLPTVNQSQKKINASHDHERVSYDMTSIETSSTSMLSKCDSTTRDYDLDDDGNDNDDPSMFSELDSLLQY